MADKDKDKQRHESQDTDTHIDGSAAETAAETQSGTRSGKGGVEETRQRRRRGSRSHSQNHHQSSHEPASHQEVMMPRRSSRTPRRLMLSIWLMIGLNFTLLIIGGMLLLGREETQVYPQPQAQGVQLSDYQRSINEAAYAGPDRVSNLLQPIDVTNPLLVWKSFPDDESPEDRWLKVVLWLSQSHYEQSYQPLVDSKEVGRTPDDRPRLGVTLAPQVQQFCKRLTNNADQDVSYRLKQYLGLDPHGRHERFVELWVRPDDLLRPCPDPETDDRYCNLKADQQTRPRVKNVDDYPAFLRQLAAESYQSEGRPWTRLGYTYDWARGNRGVGASEYMLVPDAGYRVAASYSTDEYCGWDGGSSSAQ